MKTLKQLKEERGVLITELEGIEANGIENITTEQEARVNAISDEMTALNDSIAKAEKLEAAKRTVTILNPIRDDEEEVKKRYSISRAIGIAGGYFKEDGIEAEMSQEGKRQMGSFGMRAKPNSFVIPPNMLQRTVITETGAGVKVVSFEDALQEESVLLKAGADFTSQISDARYIVPSAPTLAWETETGAANDVGAVPALVNLVPKRLAGYMDITMQMERQHDVSVDNKYALILGRAVAEALDSAAFTTNANVTGWAGTGLTASSNADAGKLALTLIEKLYESKAMKGRPAFVASAGLYAEIYSSLQVTGVTPLIMNERINSFPVYFSSAVADVSAKEMMFFANWNDYAVCQWGGVELLIDPYTQALAGTTRLVLNSFFDMAQKREASFKLGSFTGTDIS